MRASLRCDAIRWLTDDPFPGLVEVGFFDADGARRIIVDKPPIFDEADRLTRNSVYPMAVSVECEVIAGRSGSEREAVTISIERPWGLETADGCTELRVFSDQLIWR